MCGDLDFFVRVSQLEIYKCYAFCKRNLIRKRVDRTKSYREKETIYMLVCTKPLARQKPYNGRAALDFISPLNNSVSQDREGQEGPK